MGKGISSNLDRSPIDIAKEARQRPQDKRSQVAKEAMRQRQEAARLAQEAELLEHLHRLNASDLELERDPTYSGVFYLKDSIGENQQLNIHELNGLLKTLPDKAGIQVTYWSIRSYRKAQSDIQESY